MRADLSKTSHIFLFAVIFPGLSALACYALSFLLRPVSNKPYFFLVDTFGAIGAYNLIWAWFDRRGWRWPLFRWMGTVDFPDLNGRWEGRAISSYDGRQTDIPGALEIRQTFTCIWLKFFFPASNSVSTVAALADEEGGHPSVHYEYRNTPNEAAPATMHPHFGTAHLEFFSDEQMLRGSYYNAAQHDRGHIGTLQFLRVGSRLLGRR